MMDSEKPKIYINGKETAIHTVDTNSGVVTIRRSWQQRLRSKVMRLLGRDTSERVVALYEVDFGGQEGEGE
jgi:hypothetical protein